MDRGLSVLNVFPFFGGGCPSGPPRGAAPVVPPRELPQWSARGAAPVVPPREQLPQWYVTGAETAPQGDYCHCWVILLSHCEVYL